MCIVAGEMMKDGSLTPVLSPTPILTLTLKPTLTPILLLILTLTLFLCRAIWRRQPTTRRQ